MSRGRGVLVGTLLVALCAVAVMLWPQEREPVYRGKKLSEWLLSERRRADGLEDDRGQQHAIAEIGTNALPFLVRWIQYEREPWKGRVFQVLQGLEFLDTRLAVARASVAGFQALGSRAKPAIPELVPLMKGTNLAVAIRAARAIDAVGKDGLPALLDVVTNRHAYIADLTFSAVGTMWNVGTNASLVVPVLVECLRSRDSSAAATAAVLLGRIRAEPEVIVPALADCAEAEDQRVRYCAVNAIGRFGPLGRSAVPALVKALSDSEVRVRKAATNSVRMVAPEVLGEKESR